MLKQIIQKDILEDGMHYLRSPSEQFIFLQSLIDIKNFLGLSKITIPKFLNENIYKMSSVLKFLKLVIMNSQFSINTSLLTQMN